MKKFLLLTISAMAITLASCTPKMATRSIGPEEEEWKGYISEMYPGWKQPATLPQAVTITSEKVPYKRDLRNENTEVPAPANENDGLVGSDEDFVNIEYGDDDTNTKEETAVNDNTPIENENMEEPLIEDADTSMTADNDPKDEPKEGPKEDKKEQEITEYTVGKDESLSIIAKKVYGDGNKFIHIYNANKDIIKNPNRLYPGMKLIIPQL